MIYIMHIRVHNNNSAYCILHMIAGFHIFLMCPYCLDVGRPRLLKLPTVCMPLQQIQALMVASDGFERPMQRLTGRPGRRLATPPGRPCKPVVFSWGR